MKALMVTFWVVLLHYFPFHILNQLPHNNCSLHHYCYRLCIVAPQFILKQKPSLKCGARSYFILGEVFLCYSSTQTCILNDLIRHVDEQQLPHRLIITSVVNHTLGKELSLVPRLWGFQEAKLMFYTERDRKDENKGSVQAISEFENIFLQLLKSSAI